MFIFSLGGGESSIWVTCTFTIAVYLRNPVFPQNQKIEKFWKISKKKMMKKYKKNEKIWKICAKIE